MRIHQSIIFSIFLIGFHFCSGMGYAQTTENEKHIEVSLRMIGHQVLLASGDSTSRVLPIIEENGRYRIQFQTEFEFNPDVLVSAVNRVVEETNLAKNYIVEMVTCDSGKVVYNT